MNKSDALSISLHSRLKAQESSLKTHSVVTQVSGTLVPNDTRGGVTLFVKCAQWHRARPLVNGSRRTTALLAGFVEKVEFLCVVTQL